MKKTTEALINEYVSLIGGKTWKHVTHHCTGKWRGKIDHGILIDNKITLYIATGMANFENRIAKNLIKFKQFEKNKEYYLKLLQEQAEKDNIIAKEMRLHTVKVIDIGQVSPEATDGYYFVHPYILIEINGRQFKHMTTNLWLSLVDNTLQDYLKQENNRDIRIAGAVTYPDYVFCNILFSSTDGLYKIR